MILGKLEFETEHCNFHINKVLLYDLKFSVVTRCSEETSASASGKSVQTDQELLNDTLGSSTPNMEHSAICAQAPKELWMQVWHLGINEENQMM